MKIFFISLTLILGILFIGCGESYTQEDIDRSFEEGRTKGYHAGLDEGFDIGYDQGYADALAQIEITEEEKPVETTDTQIVKEWTGEGIKTTGPFIISKQPWAISWACHMADPYGGIFSIIVYTTENELVSLVANTMQSTSDISYIYKTGMFYLDIGGYGANWAIQVVQFP